MFYCIYQWEYFGFDRISTFILMQFIVICKYIHDALSNKSMKNETI